MSNIASYPMLWALMIGMLFGVYLTTIHGFLGIAVEIFCCFWAYVWLRRYESG